MKSPETKKHVVIIRNAYSYDFGGGERMPVNTASILIKNGYAATVVSHSFKVLDYARSRKVPALRGWWWSWQNWSGWRVLFIPIYLAWEFVLTIWYISLFFSLRPDVVMAQSKDDFIAATAAAKLLGKRVIWSDMADLKYIYQNNHVWYKNPVGKLVRLCSQGASAIILTSMSDKHLIETAYGGELDEKYIVIYNGISDQPKLVGRHHGGDKIVFAATSRLVTAKGIGELIEAFINIEPEINGELWLFGEGPDEAKFKVAANGHSAIKFMGFPKAVLEQVAGADVFVHPSYLEGFSISLLEAAMMGKPIIACDVGGNPELIKDGQSGFLIPPRDSHALASAMKKLALDKRLRQTYGANARQIFIKNFVFEDIVKEKYIPLYENR